MLQTVLLGGWMLILLVQLYFIGVYYVRLANRANEAALADVPTSDHARPGVTVVVCARNEWQNLAELIPLLDAQEYPKFEVLVIDDRSYDSTEDWLETETEKYSHLRYLRVEQEYDHVTPKKYAITIAVKKAVHPVVLFTDADCRPASERWLAGMVAPLVENGTSLALGVSPYYRLPGLLNFLIRSETLFTAVQYLSAAVAGRPYMGIGRNLAYRTELFFQNKGFYSHMRVLGGDDDLFVNEVATSQNTAVALHPATFAWSAPKEKWREWWHQKRRHVSVGKRYKPADRRWIGLLIGSHVLAWWGAFMLAACAVWLEVTPVLWAALWLFVLRLVLFWVYVGQISQRLGQQVRGWAIPFMDVALALYYGVMGVVNALPWGKKKPVW